MSVVGFEGFPTMWLDRSDGLVALLNCAEISEQVGGTRLIVAPINATEMKRSHRLGRETFTIHPVTDRCV